jgi:myosin heavy subunit
MTMQTRSIKLRTLCAAVLSFSWIVGGAATASAAPRDAAADLSDRIAKGRGILARQRTIAGDGKTKAEALSTDRKEKDKERAALKKSFDQHVRAGASGFKKYEAATKKAESKPPASELLETSRTEYAAAVTDGASLDKAITSLRSTEDALADLVQKGETAASDAKSAADDVKSAVKDLVKLSKDASTEANRASTAAKQSLRKTRTKTGISSSDKFAKGREKALAADRDFATTLSDAEKALADVNAAIKARQPAPTPPANPSTKPDKPKASESLFANGVSATGTTQGGDGRASGGEQRRNRTTAAPTRPGAQRKK